MNKPTKKIDFVAFSNLRPGRLYTDCKDILLSHWRELRASDEGNIYLFKYGCSLSIDINGRIGKVTYFGSFPEKRVIEGLRRGSSLDDVFIKYQSLIEQTSDEENWREFSQSLNTGHVMTLRFNKEVLAGIDIESKEAIYPKKEDFNFAKYYPEPVSSKEQHFFDANFKLVVLSALLEKGFITLGSPEELASYVLNRYIDFDEDENITGYESLSECLDYLISYPLNDDLLSQIETLYFDGGLDIYYYVYYHWDGESSEFDITSLRDVEKLPNLKKISMNSMYNFPEEEMEFNKQLVKKGIELESFND